MTPLSLPPLDRVRPRVVLTLFVAVSAACASASPAPAPDGGADGSSPAVRVTHLPPALPDGRDPLADPRVVPGGCELVTYTPAGAAPEVGELCRPPRHQRDVAVIVVHGGSGISGSYRNMRPWAARYRAEGYVTFLPEYHQFRPGSAEHPVFPRPERNIKAAVQYLRGVAGAVGIRRDRVALQGQSAGARLGAVAYTSADDPWFAGPDLHGGISSAVNAFIGFYHPYDGTMQYADQYFGGRRGDAGAVADRLDHANSLARATGASGPALFVTGSRDWNLIRAHQDDFVDVLRATGLDARAVVIDRGGHGFDEGGSRLSRLGEQSAVETLRFLNDVFPQTPARPAQQAPVDLASAPDRTGQPAVTRPPTTSPAVTPPRSVAPATTGPAATRTTTPAGPRTTGPTVAPSRRTTTSTAPTRTSR